MKCMNRYCVYTFSYHTSEKTVVNPTATACLVNMKKLYDQNAELAFHLGAMNLTHARIGAASLKSQLYRMQQTWMLRWDRGGHRTGSEPGTRAQRAAHAPRV